jgi:hypothetical protein
VVLLVERQTAVSIDGKPVVFNEDWCFSDDRRGTADAPSKQRRSSTTAPLGES